MQIIAGLDGGGTRTKILVESIDGSFQEEKEFGPFNLNSIGRPAFKKLLENITSYLESIGECEALCIGGAGISNKGMTSIINEHFSVSSVKRWKLVGDHEIVLVGALNGGKGIIFVCGTGSIALGRDNDGSYVRAGGWGHLIGDEGSGYGLGRDAFFAVTKDIDGYGCHTVLTNLIAQKLGLATQDDIISYVYSGDKSSVAALAPIVEEAYKAGDEIAIQIVRKNAEAAVDIIECVARKMRLESGKVAMHGGLVSHETSMYHEIISCMKRRMPGFSCIHPEKDSLQGALLLAREMLAE